jgi:hypothetical protein
MLPVLQRRAGLILLLGSLASAQEITGVITELGVTPTVPGLAVGGAKVTLEKVSPGDDPDVEVGTDTADGSGVFRFHLAEFGTYRVQVGKQGYIWSPSGLGSSAEVTLDRAHPTSELHLNLVRPAKVSGRLIDEETGQPISGLPISAAATSYLEGERTAYSRVTGQTGRDGQFTFMELPPGNYVIANGPGLYGPFELLKPFSEDDRKVVEQEYQWGFWPGGPDLASALPVSVGSGQSADVGTLKLRKTGSYRVHVSLPGDNCAADEKVDVTVFTFFGFDKSMDELGAVPCGGKFLVRNFQPGTFWLSWLGKRQDGKEKIGLTEFEVRDRNLDIAVPEEYGTSVDGRIIVADGTAHPDLDQIEISLDHSVATGLHPAGFEGPSKPDANGNFRIENVEPGRWQVKVSGLDGGFYVKEIRYNQVAAPDGLIFVSGPGALEVVVEDKAAEVEGVVSNGSDRVSRPEIVLAKWPPNPESVFLSTSDRTGADDGEFQFLGLAPGEYRILAVAEEAREKLQEPGVLERLMGRAQTVKLEPASVQELRLKLVDPAR